MPEELNKESTEDRGKKLMEWKFSEYVKYRREPIWYVGLGALELAVIIYSIVVNNFLFAIFAIMIGFILILHSRREPSEVSCQIFEDGVQIGSRLYEWDDIKKFRIVYQPPAVKLLYIDLKSVLIPDFAVPLKDQNPLEVRQILKTYLTEDLERPYESLADKMNRWLKI